MKVRTKCPRPRGFIDYRPQKKAAELIASVEAIISDYAEQLPLTLRQIFYILVTRWIIGKTERDYKYVLVETMSKARRGGLIPMDAIRDDGFRMADAPGWKDTGEFIEACRCHATNFRFDRQEGQDRRILIWCEAGGMVPQLEKVAHPYGVAVASSGGFDSLTSKHEIGKRLAEEPTTVLHIGDHDPSGVHIFGSLGEDIGAFAEYYGGETEFYRLAVTPEQVEEMDLPTAPPKKGDKRVFSGLTTQAEAIDPRALAKIVEEAITSRMDMESYRETVGREMHAKAELLNLFQRP